MGKKLGITDVEMDFSGFLNLPEESRKNITNRMLNYSENIDHAKEAVNKLKQTKGGGSGGGGGGMKSMKYEPKSYKSGGKVGSASKRADGIAQRGKTRGKIV
jgi:hypothetical protein